MWRWRGCARRSASWRCTHPGRPAPSGAHLFRWRGGTQCPLVLSLVGSAPGKSKWGSEAGPGCYRLPYPALPCPCLAPCRSVARAAPLLLGGLETAVRDELTTQNLAAAPRFVMVTTAGVLEMEKMRPVDVLAQVGSRGVWKNESAGGTVGGIAVGAAGRPPPTASSPAHLCLPACLPSPPLQLLEQRDQGKLEMFFKSYGAPEAAAMCIMLATAGPPQVGGGAWAGGRCCAGMMQRVG